MVDKERVAMTLCGHVTIIIVSILTAALLVICCVFGNFVPGDAVYAILAIVIVFAAIAGIAASLIGTFFMNPAAAIVLVAAMVVTACAAGFTLTFGFWGTAFYYNIKFSKANLSNIPSLYAAGYIAFEVEQFQYLYNRSVSNEICTTDSDGYETCITYWIVPVAPLRFNESVDTIQVVMVGYGGNRVENVIPYEQPQYGVERNPRDETLYGNLVTRCKNTYPKLLLNNNPVTLRNKSPFDKLQYYQNMQIAGYVLAGIGLFLTLVVPLILQSARCCSR